MSCPYPGARRSAPRTARFRSAFLSVVLLGTTLLACSDLTPTAPATAAPRSPSRPMASVAAPNGINTAVPLPVPATNSPSDGSIAFFDVGTFAPNAVVEIEVSGTISIAKNPGCVISGCPASPQYAGRTATPPSGVGTDGPGVLSVQLRVVRPDGSIDPVSSTPKPGDPTRIYVIKRLAQGGRLQVKRNAIAGWSADTAQNGYGWYALSGAQQVRVRELALVKPYATPTVTSLPATMNMVLDWAHSTVTNTDWFYVPGDTLATPAFANLSLNTLRCRTTATACSSYVAGPGRWYVALGGPSLDWVIIAGDPTNILPQYRVTVDCTPKPVVRGQTVTCAVGVIPAVAFTVQMIGALAGGESGQPHWDTLPGGGTSVAAGATYQAQGPAALTSTIYAKVQLQTTAAPVLVGYGTLLVSPRTWPLYTVAEAPLLVIAEAFLEGFVNGKQQIVHIPNDSLVSSGDFPGAHVTGLPVGGTSDSTVWDSLAPTPVLTGPNKGYMYMAKPAVAPRSTIWLSPAFIGDTPFRRAQEAEWGFPLDYCPPDSVAPYYDFVRRHEGLPPLSGGNIAANSHEGILRDWLADIHAEHQLEALVGYAWIKETAYSRASAVLRAQRSTLDQRQASLEAQDYGAVQVNGMVIEGEGRIVGCYFDKD
jgi:hypothetical protein